MTDIEKLEKENAEIRRNLRTSEGLRESQNEYIKELRAVLEEVEWCRFNYSIGKPQCWFCYAFKEDGEHKEGCRMAKALGR